MPTCDVPRRRSSGWLRSGLFVGFLIASTLATSADREKLEPPPLDDYLRWGPVRVRPGIELRNIGYDDNILYNDGERVSDYTATLVPRLDGLALLGSRAFATFRQRFDYTLYVSNADQNFLDSRTQARVTVPFRSFGVFLDLGYDRTNQRPVDREDVRPKARQSRSGYGFILYPGWRTEIEIGRTAGRHRYVDPDELLPGQISIADRLDRNDRGTNLAVKYRVVGRTSLVLSALERTIDFDVPFQGTPRDTREWRVETGMRFGDGGPLRGLIRAGRGEIDAEDPSLSDFSDWVGQLELVYKLSSQSRIMLEGERYPGFAVYEGNAYFLDSKLGIKALHYLNRTLGLEIGGSRGTVAFPASANGFEREDRTRRYQVGIRIRISENAIGQRVEYSLKVGRYRRESNVEFANQSRTTFSTGAVIGF